MSVIIQLRGGTAVEWASADPVLAEREIGVETDTMLYKLGDGVHSWSDLSYAELAGIETTLTLVKQPSSPDAPPADQLRIYGRDIAGRMLLRQKGPSGLATPLQPSFFQNFITIISTSATTALGTIGCTVTSVGTISHPAPTEQYGYMANIASAGTAAATAGTGNQAALWDRGSVPGGSNGFFYAARLAFPDVSYDASGVATGSRIFVGLTNGTMASAVAVDDPGGHAVGFQRCHTDTGRKDASWKIVTRDGTTLTTLDTGVPFIPQKVYDFYLFCAPSGAAIGWRIDNVTDGVIVDGSIAVTLPGAATALRGGVQVSTVDAVVRNVRLQRIYIESDR